MSNYTKSTNFATKDNLTPGDPLKIVRGTEIDTEFNNIATAIATKTDNSAAAITGGSITGITDLAIADGGTGASTATAAINNLLPSQTSNANKYLQTDGTNVSWDAVTLSTSDITGTLPVANGGTGVTSSTGTGSVVLSNSPTLVTPALGTPASGVATNLTGLPLSTGVTGTLPIANGGTGQTTANAAFNALAPSQATASGKYLKSDGTNTSWDALDISTADITGTLPVANGGTGVTTSTGTGNVVLSNSPTLVTPALGTPSSATLTNATGLPISTGVSGLGTGVATALAVNVGSAGAPVVNGGALGTPSSGTVTNLTGTASININGTVGATTPTTGAFTTLAASSSVTLSGGTANGVTYLNGSKVLTSGSALTFNGTNFGVGTSSYLGKVNVGVSDAGGEDGYYFNYIGNRVGSFTVNTNTGEVKIGATNTVGTFFNTFYVNNAEQMRLTSTGLGIGTSSPATRLDVAATEATIRLTSTTGTNFTDVRIVNTGGTLYSGIERSTGGVLGPTGAYEAFFLYGADRPMYIGTGNSYLRFGTNATERMRLDSAGNLGLGVTPSTWTTGKALELGTVGNSIWGLGSSNMVVGSNLYFNSTFKYANTAAATYYQQSGGVHYWFNAPSGTAGTTATFTQAMTLDASGNLLVGTTTAKTGTLSGSGNGLTIGGATAPNIALYDTTDTSYVTVLGQIDTNSYLFNYANGPMIFGTNGTERARIDSSGRLLVGTTSQPIGTAKFVSSASGSVYGGTFVTDSEGYSGLIVWNKTTSGTIYLAEFATGASYVARGSITSNGTTVAYNTSSDYRLKNTIAPMTGALAKVAQLKPCTYKWNADGSDGEGFIAHELAEVVPQAVTGEKDAVDENGNPKYQGIDTSFLVATLTAAIQEQQAIIESLKARLDAANL